MRTKAATKATRPARIVGVGLRPGRDDRGAAERVRAGRPRPAPRGRAQGARPLDTSSRRRSRRRGGTSARVGIRRYPRRRRRRSPPSSLSASLHRAALYFGATAVLRRAGSRTTGGASRSRGAFSIVSSTPRWAVAGTRRRSPAGEARRVRRVRRGGEARRRDGGGALGEARVAPRGARPGPRGVRGVGAGRAGAATGGRARDRRVLRVDGGGVSPELGRGAAQVRSGARSSRR